MATGSDFEVSDDADPIVASYDVFIKPQLKDSKKVYILQFPNRDLKQDYNTANSSLPVEFRIKDKARLVELDVPIDTHRNYDREKGVKWGEAVHRSDQSKGGEGGSHGLAGGFGIGAAAHGARPRAGVSNHEEEEVMQELLMRDFGRSVAEGKVLAKQTLGGQAIPKDSTTPQYMIGVFRNDQLHLTPVEYIVQMRPQFHHIDAQTEIDRVRSQRDAINGRVAEPRAIHMTVKPTAEGEEETTDTMAERIRNVQEEPWRKLKYVDEDSAEAWEAYQEHLFIEDTENAPKLASSMTTLEYLDSISAPRAPAKLAKLNKMKKN